MRKWLVVGALGAIAAVHVACSSDDTVGGAPTGQGGNAGAGGAGGKGGSGGTGGAAGSKASGAGGSAGAAGAAGTGTGGGGAGGVAGTGGDGGMGGAGGTNVVDPCAGKYSPLPVAVASAFTTLRICSGGTCTAPAMPYYFTPIPNPNCDETFPDGGIVPPFADAGVDGATADPDAGDAGSDGSEAAPLPVADANDAGVADAASTDAGVTADADAGANSADVTAANDATNSSDAPADISVGTDARAEGSSEAAPGDGGAPSCYEFLYNPNCTTGTCWGGVIFTQSAGSNLDPGVCIESGATKISFKAKASRPDARIKFGSTREGLGATEFFMNITTEWATYEVTLPPLEPYNSYSAGGTGVWNGFSVIVEPGDHAGGTYIFVKDAVWMK